MSLPNSFLNFCHLSHHQIPFLLTVASLIPSNLVFTPCSADQFHLQRLSTESKLSFISPQEQLIFISRQKTMDWILGLSRAYDVSLGTVYHD